MHDSYAHPLLAQIPLTVSPFVTLPAAPTLPYTYKAMPSALPQPSYLAGNPPVDPATGKPQYIQPPPPPTQPGQPPPPQNPALSTHPDAIAARCRELRSYVDRLCAEAQSDLDALEERAAARDLAEKRRVAPGWLDSEARLLQPERKGFVPHGDLTEEGKGKGTAEDKGKDEKGEGGEAVRDLGMELDLAFSGMGLGK